MKFAEDPACTAETTATDRGRTLPVAESPVMRDPNLSEGTGTAIPFPRDRSVLDFFRAQVESQPESVAVKHGERVLTYRELDVYSSRVARELVRRGLKLEEPVVVFLPASCEFLVTILGVLKAGGTYFPVDLDTPMKRLEFLLSNSGSRLMLSNEAGREQLREWSGDVLDTAPFLTLSSTDGGEEFHAPSDPNRCAYIAYTSGSSGQPKGVEIEHHSLTNVVCHYQRHLKITARDRASMLAYVAFDVSVADIWPTLCAGGIVCIPPKDILMDPDGLIRWLAEEEITLAYVPPGLVEILFVRPWPEGIPLRFLVTGGDRLRARPPAGLPFVLVNAYGPTETTVFCTWSVVTPADGTGQMPPIGLPFDNTTAYVLDEQLQPVPVNVPAELYIGGEQVARGYLGRPELTAERFLPDPFADKPSARMYRTGDWVRRLPSGELDFLGRKDGQIQIRGRRVELGEIEATLIAHEAVRHVCCVPKLNLGVPTGVIAHLVLEPPAVCLPDALLSSLQTQLPDYMVPSEFVLHESLPVTPQGKLDRAVLEGGGSLISTPFPRDRSVLDFFLTHAVSQPESVAVRQGGRLLTYRELDLYSNRIARELVRRGLKLEEPVVVLLPASGEFLTAVLGVLKAGGTYFAVGMDTPAKRLEFLLGDSACRLVLSNAAGGERLREWAGSVLDVSRLLDSSSGDAEDVLIAPSDPNRRVYITYTSGSTGQPKGVEIEHHALTNLVCYYHRRLQLTARDRAAMLAYVAFDGSVLDIWPILCAGGTVCIPPKDIVMDPDGLIRWLAEENVTLVFVPTGLAEILFARSWPAEMKLRFLITGGDRLRTRPPAGLPFVVFNAYGPTENTVISTWSVVEPVAEPGQLPPIGRPLDNTTAYVLDEELQPVPEMVAGELYLGGEQVARGYLGRPELTAERFLPDPFAYKAKARMYRTGDWVRRLPGGELDFLGRKDGQIQIRGQRAELGEVEAMLFAHEAVRQACCVPWLDDGMPSGIVAHLVLKTGVTKIPIGLSSYLEAQMPDYMVPLEFIAHENLPLTPQGKLDRAALISMQKARTAPLPIMAARGNVQERALAALWHSLLPAAGHSPADATIAALGGDSLLIIRLMLGVEEITGQRLEASTFLVNLTFAGLCEAVHLRKARSGFQPVLTLRKKGTRAPLFFLYGNTGDLEPYFYLAEALGGDQPIFGIRSPVLEDATKLPQSIEEAAADVVRLIREVQPEGAPALVGYSWGGLLAFEVARQLAKGEGIRCFTALIGTMAPIRETHLAARITHFVRHFPRWLGNLVADREHRRQRLMQPRKMARKAMEHLAEARLPVQDWVESPTSRYLVGLMKKYRPEPDAEVTVDLFRERHHYYPQPHPLHAWQTNYLRDGGWSHWVQNQLRVHWLEGDHETIIKPPLVADLAEAIRTAMDLHLKQAGSP